jgi:anaerobic selenocysteine-containing dehydrogenase
MGRALLFGDIKDHKSDIAVVLKNNKIKVLNPEYETYPSVFYFLKGEPLNSSLKDYDVEKVPSAPRVSVRRIPDKSEPATKLIYSSDAMCPSECGIRVLVENGVAKSISGNPHSLINNGTLCAKGASGLQLTYSPNRIKTPLMRIGQRGEDTWKEISWDEATDYIAKKLISIKLKYGPESVFLDCGDVTDREAYYRLFHAFGTPNTYNHGSICDTNRRWGQWIMTGDERPLPDIQRPILIRNDKGELQLKKEHDIKLLLNIGANPLVATRFNYMSSGIPSAREKNGCIYIVVDPVHTNSAAHADIWLPIIPGSDAALLAAMLYYIVKNDSPLDPARKYIDHDFINRYTIGWHDFRDTFLAYSEKKDPSNDLYFFTGEWAEDKTGISIDNINKISHLFGITKPAAIEIGMHGTSHHTNGDVTSVLMTALCLITGNMDCPGGLVFIESLKPKRGIKTSGIHFLGKITNRKINGKEVSGKLLELNKDTFGDFPAAWKGVLTDLPQKIRHGIRLKHGPFKGHEYPVKAFITRAGNPVITAGNTPDWIEAITARDENGEYLLELMVFIDTHITETGKYADIILPEAGFLERMGVSDVYTMSPEIAIRDRVIKPLYGSKTPFEIMSVLAEALIKNGDPDIRAEDFMTYKNEEDFINEILREAPGFFNVGDPLPYPDLPEGCLIIGTPDNPFALWGHKVIKKGEYLSVEWLRKNNGVVVWPASYYRYRKLNGTLSGIYPRTASRKFEFKFSYLENINKRFGLNLPTGFYWSESKWNPKSHAFKKISEEYSFQLISGRVHHAMTMTIVCPNLAETTTECMKPLNEGFKYMIQALKNIPHKYGIPVGREIDFESGSVSIPVFAFNSSDGVNLGIKTGDMVILENPLKRRIKGKVFLTDEVMPGVIKTAFGPGGHKASGLGFMTCTSDYTPNINELHDPENISPFTGMPGFGDIMVRVIKI